MSHPTVITNDNIHELVLQYMNNDPDFPDGLEEIRNWDVSRVTYMDYLFHEQSSFNEPIGGWNVSNVTSMESMFQNATAFNQPIGGWDVSNVTSMKSMFANATSFNQPIDGWNVSRVSVSNMKNMFHDVDSFSQSLARWGVPLLALFSNEEYLKDYIQRVQSNVRVARTTKEYMSMCLTAKKTDEDCLRDICPHCLQPFIQHNLLRRPVMFHKSVGSNGQEMWSCPVHANEVRSGSCIKCRTILSIPQIEKDDAMNPEMFEVPNARAIQLQSVLRGHLTRRTVAKLVKREREYRKSRKEFHDSYVKQQQQRQHAIKHNRAAFNAAFPPSRSRSRSRVRSNSMTRSKTRSKSRSNRHSAGF